MKALAVPVLVLLLAASLRPAAAEDQSTYQTGAVTVVGVSPVLGAGIDITKVPANVRVIDPTAEKDKAPQSAADLMNGSMGSVSTADYQGNALQPSLSFRGFTASPTLGEPQGLAVYQNGMRLNEAFGDLVNWDMSPSFAIGSLQVLPGSNPVFGLNALGGAVAMRMKDGFSNPGTFMDLGGGSFGRGRLVMESGQNLGNQAVYSGIGLQTDDGWRQHSPSKLVQSYTDLAVRKGDLDVGLGLTLGDSSLSGLGTSPVQLLDQSRSAVYTAPDQTENALAALDLRGNYQLSPSSSLQGSFYYRHLRSVTHNGDASGFSACAGDPTTLCDNDGNTLTNRAGNTISSSLSSDGVVNNTQTTSDSAGAALQYSHDGQLAGLKNNLISGVTSDQGWTSYGVDTELAGLTSDRTTSGSGIYLGGTGYNVGLGARNAYWGAYVSDTVDLTDRWAVTAAGRLNTATIALHDEQGTSLNGHHSYERFNPSLGATWQAGGGVTAYASYSEANRVPTAAELACADPSQPCRVPNAFISDPGLHQVVSHSFEVGARGSQGDVDKMHWSLAAYTTRNTDDIIFVSSGPTLGGGYFSNAGATLRQGIEADADIERGNWRFGASYGLTRAVFDTTMTLYSPNNSGADGSGNIQVKPGSRLPGIPLHNLKLEAGYSLSSRWAVESDTNISSDRVLRGDEANDMKKIGGYAVFNAGTSYQLTDGCQVYMRALNLLNRRYSTAGTLGDPSDVFASYTDKRFETPGAPFSLWIGTRISL
ncbi:MAG TPA: TonB-dependent receptor [Candidatus Sulfotelmatobacter sp.]|jgi:outer membrane receptor protein involved in Fe transport|nr:TonB-dependent receptor [Candidatus Sulfotelmatobacter sp.]